MRPTLLDLLICPACLPAEHPLRSRIRDVRQGDIHSAELECPTWGRQYPVRDGLALLLADGADEPGQGPYETPAAISSYLWSHYADLFGDPAASAAYGEWSRLLCGLDGPALDVGCAVGRLTFELARETELAIGVDRSQAFVRTARQLASAGELHFCLVMEGALCETRQISLPHHWPRERAEFIVADAQALPFPSGLFARGGSLNLLDKLPDPQRHLDELNRVLCPAPAQLLISDPWSWSTAVAAATAWLGGTDQGPWAGHAHANLRRHLQTGMTPPWEVTAEGTVAWTVRNHRNHYERISSDYLVARR